MEPRQSPLFMPALWEGNHFKVLDETLLPRRLEYITVKDLSQALWAVREMKTRAFGQVLTFIYAAALVAQGPDGESAERLRERLDQMTMQFTQARPTFDFPGLSVRFREWFRKLPPGQEAGSWIHAKALETVASMMKSREERARRAAELLPDRCRLLTHCNISGELVAVARACTETGKELHVVATETRPYLQGSRLTAWELAQAGIPVSLIPDCAIAQVMARGEIDAVLVGADRCAQNGDIINKVGTYPLALVAREYGVPFHALVQDPGPLATGKDVTIEERPPGELLTFQGRSLATPGVKGFYPAFDLTPQSLISYLIHFDGAFTPESFRKKFKQKSEASERPLREAEKFLLLYGVPKTSIYGYLARALKAERLQTVLVPEMRPELWGAHVLSRELVRRNIPVTLISDNMMGTLFSQGRIQRLYLFYLELTPQGPKGICGSLLASHLAHAHGVQVEILDSEAAQTPPLDRDISTFLAERVVPEGVAIYPIEKEVVPWRLLKEN